MGIQVLVPPLGQTVDTVTLVAWLKDEGDTVTQGESLFTIETDKATLDIEAPASGVLRQVTAWPGDQVRVLSTIAAIEMAEEATETTAVRPGPPPTGRSADRAPAASPREMGKKHPERADRIFISPRARRLADRHRISLSELQPSGPEGAIVERDVRAYLDAGSRPDVASAGRAAHVTLNVEADVTSLCAVCSRLAQDGLEVSYDDLFLYILGRALQSHPGLSARFHEGGVEPRDRVHVGLVVDADGQLVIPVVRDVDQKGLRQLAAECRSLFERARAGLCTPAELSGATLTLANLGRLGIDSFSGTIQPFKCATLGFGRIKTQPAFDMERVVARQTMWLSLTFDRRLVDSGPAARFLQRVVQLVEQPHLLFT